MTDCIFCRIVKGELPGDIVYQDDKVTAFRDISPKAPTHILIIPNQHMDPKDNLQYEDAAVMVDILLAAKEIARIENIEERGFRLLINVGADAGQEVDHLHMHLFGGKKLGPMLVE